MVTVGVCVDLVSVNIAMLLVSSGISFFKVVPLSAHFSFSNVDCDVIGAVVVTALIDVEVVTVAPDVNF